MIESNGTNRVLNFISETPQKKMNWNIEYYKVEQEEREERHSELWKDENSTCSPKYVGSDMWHITRDGHPCPQQAF